MTPPTESLRELKSTLLTMAQARGFDALGVSDLELGADARNLDHWLDAGKHGEMSYMAKHGTRRTRPDELVPGTVRVLSARMNYWPGDAHDAADALADAELGYVSRYAVGRDYRAGIGARLKLAPRAIDVGVRIALQLAAGESRCVDERGVIELVFDADVVAIEECRDRAKVRGPSVAEQQCALAAGPSSERIFERGVLIAVAAEQRRRRRADAPARRRVDQRVAQRSVLREAEIIVARKVQELLAGDLHARPIDRLDRADSADERCLHAFRVTRGDAIRKRGPRHVPRLRRYGFDDLGVHRSRRDLDFHRTNAEPREQPLVVLDIGIAGRQQLLAVKNRVRAGEEAQRL